MRRSHEVRLLCAEARDHIAAGEAEQATACLCDLEDEMAERAERTWEMQREVEFVGAERRRLERLLAEALLVATAGTTVSPTALLEVLADVAGTDPAHPAFLEERTKEHAATQLRHVIKVLQETAP